MCAFDILSIYATNLLLFCKRFYLLDKFGTNFMDFSSRTTDQTVKRVCTEDFLPSFEKQVMKICLSVSAKIREFHFDCAIVSIVLFFRGLFPISQQNKWGMRVSIERAF